MKDPSQISVVVGQVDIQQNRLSTSNTMLVKEVTNCDSNHTLIDKSLIEILDFAS